MGELRRHLIAHIPDRAGPPVASAARPPCFLVIKDHYAFDVVEEGETRNGVHSP